MFITEQVAYIKANYGGGWTVRFATSPRFFQYNKARLLFLSAPEVIDLEEKGMYVNNKMKIVAYGFRGEERYFHLRLYALHDCCFTPQVKMNLKNDPLLCHLIKE